MGRVKLPIKKIENNTNRQVTFSKRRNGLIKKAYELSVLCDIDIGLIMFSPSSRLSHFSGRRRIEDVLERYLNLQDHERVGLPKVDKMFLMNIVNRLRSEGDGPVPLANSGAPNPIVEKLQQDIVECRQQLQIYMNCLSLFEHNPSEPPPFPCLSELIACEEFLKHSLARVIQKKSSMQPQEQGMFDGYLLGLDHPPSESINFSNRDLPMQISSNTSMPLRDQVTCGDPSTFQMDPQLGIWQQICLAPTLPLQQTPSARPPVPSPEGAMMKYSQEATLTMSQLPPGEKVPINCSQTAPFETPHLPTGERTQVSFSLTAPSLPSREAALTSCSVTKQLMSCSLTAPLANSSHMAPLTLSKHPSGEGAAVGGERAAEDGSVGDAPAGVNGESGDELLPESFVDELLNDSDDATGFVNGGSADEQVTDGSGRDAPVAVSGGSVDVLLLPGDSVTEQRQVWWRD